MQFVLLCGFGLFERDHINKKMKYVLITDICFPTTIRRCNTTRYFQNAAEGMESETRSEQYRVAKMTEQLVLDGTVKCTKPLLGGQLFSRAK